MSGMKHYRSPDGKVYGFEADGSQDHLIQAGMEEISAEDLPQVLASLLKPRPVPAAVSMAAARIVLHRAGLLEGVELAVAAAFKEAQIEWEYRTEVWRNSALTQTLAEQLDLTGEQLDQLFIAAAALEPSDLGAGS